MLTLSGCDDPKKATTSNFRVAAQRYLDTVYPSCYIKANFPYVIDSNSFYIMPEILNAMVGKGLLTRKELLRKHINDTLGVKVQDYVVRSYELTEEGRKYYKRNVSTNIQGDELGAFCFGRATVKEINSFTELSDVMGYKASMVTFTYKVSEIPGWVKSPEILNSNIQIKKEVYSEHDGIKISNFFLLTNKGWVHEQLVGK
ncbi:hypothetical protein [Klebsiella aerogenes]|uniref:hypothetical protein n=1 Tax=Klebsiella aerogenes TaxID=548 RepID=UPI0012DC99DB|nr:hypothetical protein [Klebsiella aerogenes]